MRYQNVKSVFVYFSLVLCLIGILAPYLILFFNGGSLDYPSGPIMLGLFGRTCVITSLSALVSVAYGSLLAFVIHLRGSRFAELWMLLVFVPFAVPSTAWALAQLYCFGPGGFLDVRSLLAFWPDRYSEQFKSIAAGLVLAQIYAPISFSLLGRAINSLHASGLEAAESSIRGVWRVVWLWKALRSEIVIAWLLTFFLSFGNFGVPQVFQCNLYIIDIYQRVTTYQDYQGAIVAAAPIFYLGLAGTLLIALMRKSEYTMLNRPLLSQTRAPSRNFVVAKGFIFLFVLVTVGMPLFGLIRLCGSWNQFGLVVKQAVPELCNSLFYSILAASFCIMCVGLMTRIKKRLFTFVMDMIAHLPIVIPPLLLGVGTVLFYNRRTPVNLTWIIDSRLLLIGALALRGLPFAFRIIVAAISRFQPGWKDAVDVHKPPFVTRWVTILGPIQIQGWLSAWLLVFILSLGDIELSQLLSTPGFGTLSMRLFTFLHFGPIHVAAGLATLQILIVLFSLSVFFVITKRAIRLW